MVQVINTPHNPVTIVTSGANPVTVIGTSEINVLLNGLKGDGTDDTVALIALLASAGANSTLFFPEGTYLFTDEVLISNASVYFVGESQRGTNIQFLPTSNNQGCFHWELAQTPGGISNFWFTSTDTTYVKTAIKFEDGSDFHVEKIHIGLYPTYWTDTSKLCVGISGYGREVVSISKVRIFADKPIVLGGNPNDLTLDVDQFHLSDTYLVNNTGAYHPKIEVLDGVNIYNLTIDGYNAWAKGRYGFYWNSPNSTAISYHIKISNIRHEQGVETGGTGYVIYINHDDFLVHKLIFDNIYGDVGLTDGIYLKGIQDVRMTNVTITGKSSGTPLEIVDNAAGATQYIEWDNCSWGTTTGSGASVIPDTLTLLNAIPAFDSEYSLPMSARYKVRKTNTYTEDGVFVAENLHKNYFARSLLAPQTNATGDLTMSATGKTITSAGAMSFTGMLRDELINLDTVLNPNTMFTLAADATATVITVNEDVVEEPGVDGTVIHGMSLWHRSSVSYVQKTDISIYASAQSAANQALHVTAVSGKLGDSVSVAETNNLIFKRVNVSTSTAPTADFFTYTATTVPARIWNNRTTDPGVARVIVEQLNF